MFMSLYNKGVVFMKVKKYYNQYLPYVVFTYNGNVLIRRLYNDNKENKTGIIILNKQKIKVEYFY